jgi:uncharacterized protein
VAGVSTRRLGQPLRKRFLAPLGLFAGFLAATGGGGWGPVGTPALLSSGRLEPRRVVGSIDASEFMVALAASLGFLLALGSQGINYSWVLALLAGGVVAAPLAAYLVRVVPARILGVAVGGRIVLTNSRTLLRSEVVDAGASTRTLVYVPVLLVWAVALAYAVTGHVRTARAVAAEERATQERTSVTGG